MNRRGEVAVEVAAGKDGIHVTRAIELELIHAIIVNHVHADIAEGRVVLRTGKSVSVFDYLVSGSFSELNPLFLRIGVPAPSRHPYDGIGTVLLRSLLPQSKAIRKPIVELPEGLVVVPTVIEEERIQLHAALLRQFASE